MAASVIYSSKREFNGLINEIKDHIKCIVGAQSGNVVEVKLDVMTCGHGYRPFGDNLPTDYIDLTLEIGNKEWDGLGRNDIAKIGSELERFARGLGADVEMRRLNYTFDYLHSDGEFPSAIRFFCEGCEEFKELQHLVLRDGIKLNCKDLYRVRLFGKRGEYGESGKRCYTAYNAKECERLVELVKSKNVKIKTIDDIDVEGSIRYETECYGSRIVTLVAA